MTSSHDHLFNRNHQNSFRACESGSRAWQFPSTDSDYDVRFIYARPFEDYLSVFERDDQIGFLVDGDMDVCGWDIRKVLRLLRKSNSTPFEWLQSPIVYLQQPGFRDELWDLCGQYFCGRANAHHYLGIARSAWGTMAGSDEIKIKKLFYVLRPLLAAKWCLEKNSIAPMSVLPLMALMPDDLRRKTAELIAFKSTTAEGCAVSVEPDMRQYIEHEFAVCEQVLAETQKANLDAEPLNIFFKKIIRQ